jgi:hypothetical protein
LCEPSRVSSLGDVLNIRKLIEKQYHFKRENIFIMLDSKVSCGKATSSNILKKLYALIQKSKAGDRLLVYFTGHGNRAKAEANTNNTNFVEFIVTADNTTISGIYLLSFLIKIFIL